MKRVVLGVFGVGGLTADFGRLWLQEGELFDGPNKERSVTGTIFTTASVIGLVKDLSAV